MRNSRKINLKEYYCWLFRGRWQSRRILSLPSHAYNYVTPTSGNTGHNLKTGRTDSTAKCSEQEILKRVGREKRWLGAKWICKTVQGREG